jgi:hypothetical protein
MSALSASADTLSSTSGQHPRNDILSVFGSFGESPLSSSAPSIRRSQNLVKSLCLSRRSLFSNTFVAHRFNLGDIVVINQPTSCGLKVKPGSVGRVVCIDRSQLQGRICRHRVSQLASRFVVEGKSTELCKGGNNTAEGER